MKNVQRVEFYHDNRARRFFDLYEALEGQITVSIVQPHQFSGWHMHKKQTDYFSVVDGLLKIIVISPEGDVSEYLLSSENPRSLRIQPHHIHGYKSSDQKATLVYYLSRKHDESDEYRFTDNDIFNKYGYSV